MEICLLPDHARNAPQNEQMSVQLITGNYRLKDSMTKREENKYIE
jgi:hypothetical protein